MSSLLPVPALIRVLRWLTPVFAGAMFLSIILVLLEIGPVIMGGQRVDRDTWLHVAAPLVAVIGTLTFLASVGLARRRAWARHLIILMFAFIIAYAISARAFQAIPNGMMWRAIGNASFAGALSVWYFYFKKNVASYFAALK